MNTRHSTILALALGGCTSIGSSPPPEVQVFGACEGRDFAIIDPIEGRPWTPNAITLVSAEVADGVFAVYDTNTPTHEPAGYPLETSGGFVIGEEGVLIVETMVNRQLLCQVYNPRLLDGHAQEGRETLATVQASLPAGAVVIPGHGRPTGAGTFSFSMDYLDALNGEVGASVDELIE